MPPPNNLVRAARAIENVVRGRRVFEVEKIYFLNSIEIWYARIPDPADTTHANVAWSEPRPDGFNLRDAVAPARRLPADDPSTGNPLPHWAVRPGNANSPVSWPVAFVRGPNFPPGGEPKLRVQFRCTSHANFNGPRDFKADSVTGLQTNTKTVDFVNSVGTAEFKLTNVPSSVQRLSREALRWQISRQNENQWKPVGQTQHTFFFVLNRPVPALGMVGNASAERHYFELFDWSCRWALGQNSAQNVLNQIWQKFRVVGQPHDTGLIYWRNFQAGISPAQNMADGIRAYDAAGNQQYAVSCIVFDRMFCNSLAVHGIRSAEMMLTAHPPVPNAAAFLAKYNSDATFKGHVDAIVANTAMPPHWDGAYLNSLVRGASKDFASVRSGMPADYRFTFAGGEYFKPSSWKIAHPAGHGNTGPNQWESHWIADVNLGGSWVLYDPSYGATQPWTVSSAGATLVPPAVYEQGSVTFDVVSKMTGAVRNIPSNNPNDPRLDALCLYIN